MRREEGTQAALEAALAENERLRAEIEQLEDALAGHSTPAASGSGAIPCLPGASEIGEATTPADKAAKVALFRSLFRGREDVYAERWRRRQLGIPASRPEELGGGVRQRARRPQKG